VKGEASPCSARGSRPPSPSGSSPPPRSAPCRSGRGSWGGG
jgi:hypothetical protein